MIQTNNENEATTLMKTSKIIEYKYYYKVIDEMSIIYKIIPNTVYEVL